MAFSIDFEVESDGNAGVKLHCAALSAEWNVSKFNSDLTKLAQEIAADEECKNSGIPLNVDIKDINAVELYINRLGCTPGSLKSPAFQKFIGMPSSVESGVKYARDKTFGDVKIEKSVTVHPRYVRRAGSFRLFRVTSDRRGGFLLLYANADESVPVQTFKVAAKQLNFTIMNTIPNCLVVKSANRQWAVQFQTYGDLKDVVNAINEILKSVKSDLIELPSESGGGGGSSATSPKTTTAVAATTTTTVGASTAVTATANVNVNVSANTSGVGVGVTTSATVAATSNSNSNNDYENKEDELSALNTTDITSAFGLSNNNTTYASPQEENQALRQELDQLRSQVETMGDRVNELKREKNLQISSAGDVETKIDREIALEKKRFTDTFRIEIQNLKNHIKEIKPLLKAQSAVKNAPTDKKEEKKTEEEEKEYQADAAAKEWEDKVGLDVARKILQKLDSTQDKGQIRFRHMHVHRHQFKHIHSHNHVHLDEEAIKETTNVEDKFKNKHTVRHTISHTNTQYLVPKRWFQT